MEKMPHITPVVRGSLFAVSADVVLSLWFQYSSHRRQICVSYAYMYTRLCVCFTDVADGSQIATAGGTTPQPETERMSTSTPATENNEVQSTQAPTTPPANQPSTAAPDTQSPESGFPEEEPEATKAEDGVAPIAATAGARATDGTATTTTFCE